MKRLWTVSVLLMALSIAAKATTISRIVLSPNFAGDNFGFLEQGTGFRIGVSGGTPVDFFSDTGYAPGSTLGGYTSVFFDGGVLTVGGHSEDLLFNGPGTLFMSSFTLPTNGALTFTTTVSLSFYADAYTADTSQPITIDSSATGRVTFTLSEGTYYAHTITATTAPEPGTLALVGTGIMSILFGRRRFKI